MGRYSLSGGSFSGKEMEKKRESHLKLVKLEDATNLINQEANLLGIVLERREPKRCRNNNWICTLRIIDDSYPIPGVTVNVFSNKLEELPNIKNHNDIILFIRVKMQSFDGGKRVSAACNQRVSSFALYEPSASEGFVCYQCTSNFHGEEQYKSSVDELGKFFASSITFGQALGSSSNKGQTPEKFSFLREIKERKFFDLVCKVIRISSYLLLNTITASWLLLLILPCFLVMEILHVNEDLSTIFVWDGTDAPPASIGIEEKSFSNLSVHTLLSRDILLSFPTIGTILRVSPSNQLFHGVKPGDWVKLYKLLCVVDKGSWIGKVTDSTTVRLAQDDRLVKKIVRIYNKRISSKLGHIPYWSFPSPSGLTEIDDDQAPFVTLMDIITYPKVTYKYRCIVRVVSALPWQVEEFSSDENRRYRVLLTLEDPTATLEAFLCDKDSEYFWGKGLQNTEMLRTKWNRLLGIKRESSISLATRNPPWIECCIFSYYTHKAEPWKTRLYRIFGTRLHNV